MGKRRPLYMGVAGAVGLLFFYFAVLSLVNSAAHAAEEFARLWYWILALAAGFGIQVGLYSFVRREIGERIRGATAEVAAAAGVSSGSMIACCAHHVATDLLPIMGISAASVFLSKYQVPLIATGIFSNVIGASLMLNVIQRHDLYPNRGFLAALRGVDAVKVRNAAIALAVFFVPLSFALSKELDTSGTSGVGERGTSSGGASSPSAKENDEGDAARSGDAKSGAGETRTNDENSVEIAVTPVGLGPNAPAAFEIVMNTHSVELDFDLVQMSSLEDDRGTIYRPVKWEGSPPGGHHRSGVLTFPKLSTNASSVKLIIKNVADVPRRDFEWRLRR